MTDEEKAQLRVKVAEICGWKHAIVTHDAPIERDGFKIPGCFWKGDKFDAWWHPDSKGVFVQPTDYPNDLNAMHEAELRLTDKQHDLYRFWLEVESKKEANEHRAYASASATQRALAFVRVWEVK